MAIVKKEKQWNGNVFEQTVLQALDSVKNGSITVVKQDNVIIQVNIFENLNWSHTAGDARTKCNRLGVLV